MDTIIDIETEKSTVDARRRDLIINLDSIITEAQRLKNILEEAGKTNDYSTKTATGGSICGMIALPATSAVKTESEYNTHLKIVQNYELIERRKAKNNQ